MLLCWYPKLHLGHFNQGLACWLLGPHVIMALGYYPSSPSISLFLMWLPIRSRRGCWWLHSRSSGSYIAPLTSPASPAQPTPLSPSFSPSIYIIYLNMLLGPACFDVDGWLLGHQALHYWGAEAQHLQICSIHKLNVNGGPR